MAKKELQAMVMEQRILNRIYVVRNEKIMLDRDLAELYGIETKVLKQAVKRNIARFPKDFMFEMNKKEFDNWRTQNATSKEDKQGLRYAPFCFTEQGVTMLSCVLSSDRAIDVNIQIIRIFTKMKELLLTHKGVLLQMQKIEKKLTAHDEDIKKIFEVLKKLINPPQEPRRRIGFKPDDI